MNSVILADSPARELVSAIIRASRKRVSKRDLLVMVEEYGVYLNAYECDRNLIADTIKENTAKTLVSALEELNQWYLDMDMKAAKA